MTGAELEDRRERYGVRDRRPCGNGHYNHVINDTGSPTSGTSTVPSTVVSYP